MESFDATVVNRVLELRKRADGRAALRRAASPTTEGSAYGYLSWVWTGDKSRYRKQPTLALAALAGMHIRLEQQDGASLGKLAGEIVNQPKVSGLGLERRLVLMQTQSLEGMLRIVRTMFAQAERASLGVDWLSVYRTLLRWDHPDQKTRLRARRRVLEDFYAQDHTRAEEPGKGSEDEAVTASKE